MSNTFDSLRLLHPVFVNNLGVRDIHALAHELYKQKCISEGALQSITTGGKEEPTAALINAVLDTSKSGWENSLIYCLQTTRKPKLAQVVECWFNPEQNVRISWIVHSWDEWLKYEKQVKESTWLMTTHEFLTEQWLLDFCCYIASEETDSPSKTKLVEMLQGMLAESDVSVSIPPGFEIISWSSVKSEANEAGASTHVELPHQIQAQNFEISSSSSSDSKENFVDTVNNQEPCSSSIPKVLEVSQDVEMKDETCASNRSSPSVENITDFEMQDASEVNVESPLEDLQPTCVENVLPSDVTQLEPNHKKDVFLTDLADSKPSRNEEIETLTETSIIQSLFSLLHSCLSDIEIKSLAGDMRDSGHLSAETYRQIKQARRPSKSRKDLLLLLIDGLIREAKEEWKASLLFAFEGLDRIPLYEVMERYFDKPRDDLVWIVANWNLLLDRKEDCMKIAEQLQVLNPINEQAKCWLLHYIHQVLQAGDDKLQRVVGALQNKPEAEEEVDDATPSIMEQVDNILNPLLPILRSCMTKRQLIALAKRLAVKSHISGSSLKEFVSLSTTSESEDAFSSFVTYFGKDAQTDWDEALLKALPKKEFATLLEVLKCYFHCESKNLSWFLQNWDSLQDRKDELLEIAQKREMKVEMKAKEKSWLLSYVNQILRKGDDALKLVIDALSKVEALVDDQTPSTGDGYGCLSNDVDESLTPLILMLKWCLPDNVLSDIATDLCVSEDVKHLTEESANMVMESVDNDSVYEDSLLLFIDCLRKDAQANWKTSFLDSLKNQECDALHFFILHFSMKPTKFTDWVVKNWEELESGKQHLVRIAHTRKIGLDITPESELCVLRIVNEALNHGDDDLQWLITKFMQAGIHKVETQKPSSDPEQESLKTSKQKSSSLEDNKEDDDVTKEKKGSVISTDQINLSFNEQGHSEPDRIGAGDDGTFPASEAVNILDLDGSKRAIPVQCMAATGDPALMAPEKQEQKKVDEVSDEATEKAKKSTKAYGSNVKKLKQDFEGKDNKEPMPPKRRNSTKNQANKGAAKDNKDIPEKKKDEKPSYANTVATGKGETKANQGKKKQRPIPKPNVPDKHKNATDEEVEYVRLKNIPYGQCRVEFRARLAETDIVIPKNSTLLLYLENESDRGTYPMQFYPKFNEYRLVLTLSVSRPLTYKYCINDVGWEFLLSRDRYDGILNRQWTLNYEQKDDRYAIKFDVVLFHHYHTKQYMDLVVENISAFLNCDVSLDNDSTNENIIIHTHNVYRNWFIGVNNDPYTVQKNFTSYVYTSEAFKASYGPETKMNAVSHFIDLIFSNVDDVARVLCMLAFVTAMDKEIGEKFHLNYKICKALSVDNLKEQSYELLVTHLQLFSQMWALCKKSSYPRSSLLMILENFFKTVSNIPESLLIAPLVSLMQSIADVKSKPGLRPAVISSKFYLNKQWYSRENQKVIMALRENVLNLVRRFPWIRDTYADMLTVETAAEIINEKSQFSTLIDVDIAFVKFLNFWNAVAAKKKGTPDFNETTFLVIVGYITSEIEKATERDRSELDECHAKTWLRNCEDILKSMSEFVACHSKACHVGCIAFTLTLMDYLIEYVAVVEKSFNQPSKELAFAQESFRNSLMDSTRRLFDTVDPHLSATEIDLWNTLSNFNWTNKTVKQHWINHCEKSVVCCVKQKFGPEDLINFYAYKLDAMKPNEMLVKCFTDVLTSKIGDEVLVHRPSKWLGEYFAGPNLLKVIWEVVKKKWKSIFGKLKNLKTTEIVLSFLDQWPPATFFLRKLYEGFKTADSLSDEKEKFISTVSHSLILLVSDMNRGEVDISCLAVISRIETFWKCYDEAILFNQSKNGSEVDEKYFSQKQFAQLLDRRQREMSEFYSVKKYMDEFVQFSLSLRKSGIDLDCAHLQRRLDENFTGYNLRDLVKCERFPSESDLCQVVFFPVASDDLKAITDMMKCLKSAYTRKLVRETAADCGVLKMSISDFLKKVWTPAHSKIEKVCEELDDGSISFEVIEKLFEHNLNANRDEVTTEMNIMFEILERFGRDSTNFKERSKQVHNYLIIKRQQKVAAVLIAIKEKLNLKGKFDAFQQPLNVGDSLASITEDTIRAVSILKDVTEPQLRVLQAFCEGEILLWLKENMKDRSEVKVMSDLAMISAGETPMDVDRVSCFLSAVMGFSPLVFDLTEDAGLNELLTACRVVWENVERDDRLIKKWIDLSKQMEWLKNVKELHGSVEKSSLIRAQEINERGIYVIGKENKKIPKIENCLLLRLPAMPDDRVKDIEMLLEEKKELIKELIEEEIPEDVAKAAVQLAPSLDFNECYQWASKNFKNEALVSEYQKKFEEEDAKVQSKILLKKKWQVIRRLVERGVTERAAKAAVQCVPSLDEDKCCSWVTNNIGNESLIVENQKKFNQEAGIVEMTLNEVHDLQSRLMLIAGEADRGKDDIIRFTDVLSNVESLAKAYVKLKQSGCLLFENWTASIRCSNDKKAGYTIKVSFHKSSPLSSGKEVVQEIKNLTEVLLEAHKKWMDYLCEKRDEHYHLNHFNIHQLTYLCKKLSCSDGNDFPDQVYQFLSTVASKLSYSDIIDMLEDVTKINDDTELADVSILLPSDTCESKLEKKKKVIRGLVHLEISEETAKAAVQSVPSLDVDECYLWALANQCDESLIDEMQRNFEEEAGFGTSNTDITAIQDVINERVNLTLDQVIERIQRDFDDSDDVGVGTPVKTVCERYLSGTAVTSMEDCISLEHLGQFLTMISPTFEKHRLPVRECPEGLYAGKPNLVVCPKVDMWRTILSIYMTSSEQCLPSAAEVLVCNETTTPEEIELLLRRAMQHPVDEGKRIYCLACADDISFNVAEEAENMFRQLNQSSGRDTAYRLVVLVSSLHHYITSLFDEYKVEVNFMKTENAMKAYICKHLSTRVPQSVSVIDRDRNLVRLVCSDKAGMGKSLFVQRCKEKLTKKFKDEVYWNSSIIRFLEKKVDVDDTIATLTHSNDNERAIADPHFIHIDITPAVQTGVHKFLFDLVILGELKSSDGVIWRRCAEHFYALEYTFPSGQVQVSFANILDLLPKISCISPQQVMKHLQDQVNQRDPKDRILMDETLLKSEMYQRPYQYLSGYSQKQDLDNFTYTKPIPNPLKCLETLLKYCSVLDPSWAELSHFSKFLNTQLYDCENSLFLNIGKIKNIDHPSNRGYRFVLTGFKHFVVRFMIRMSQDFATPSLKMNEDAENDANEENDVNDVFELHQLRRRWENDFHPYLFFNADRMSFSFVHFNINDKGDLCNPKTNAVFEPKIMTRQLLADLKNKYKVKVSQDFDQLSREEKLQTLCNVFGVRTCFDPDPTYELTTDNVLKMLAIQMRFRCGIPVVIMGETGCGKTRMVEFMSKLKAGGKKDVQNMVVVKVHGGVTVATIHEKVKEAVTLAQANATKSGLETTLFLDEANTTEAIYAIKEIVCDATVHGETFAETGLKIVAACNPYRKHPEQLIEKMDQSGLGFHVKTEDVTDKLGAIPMRHLVYRVIPLPPSMKPLVWDFGQLNNDTEEIYIRQMVLKLQNDVRNGENLENLGSDIVQVITKCLSESQVYMRNKEDVCSFVSLRDVERTIQTFRWFYQHLDMLEPLLVKEKAELRANTLFPRPIQALMHSLGICYHATLDDRKSYREIIADVLADVLKVHQEDILSEIIACQNAFINAIELKKDVGRNEALRENVFMMVMCAEMRIPLFLVGKPGSSKSLAKTIVTDAMQGVNSTSDLFKKLKQIHVLSFQCSAVSDAVGIEAVFNQCAQLQKNQPQDKFVAVVVLDEIGLAEDSPKMPLKVLHPLLENAFTATQLASDRRTKVGFVGISNWALDPAKMNRGIFVTRGKPSPQDLQKTAEAIFESDKEKIQGSGSVIKALTSAYLQIYDEQAKEKEFFGLRDYYGLLKMLFAKLSENEHIDFMDIAKLVLRNFSGYKTDVFHVFKKWLLGSFDHVYDPKVTVMELIHENLNSTSESRFLLLLTNQYSAVSLLPEVMGDVDDYQVVFGSSFPRDNDYTEVCRNINRIKVCMETGRTVVLLNLRDLYESLYDALNQHYVTFSGQNYVDLGLGGHRVKCRIAENFRLIVIEEKDVVYEKFPIPLINRLEKHVLEMNSVLSNEQTNLVNILVEWVKRFTTSKAKSNAQSFSQKDTFPGYTEDTPASAVAAAKSNDLESTKKILLQTASLDSVCRLSESRLNYEAASLQKVYLEEQVHDSLLDLLKQEILSAGKLKVFEVTSFSQMLHDKDRQTFQSVLKLNPNSIMLLTLQQISTERSFSEKLDFFFESVQLSPNSSFVLLIQCPQAQLHGNLIACAKYATMNKVKEVQKRSSSFSKVIIVFLFTMERHINAQENQASFTSFHSPNCASLYIDELKPSRNHIAPVSVLWKMTIPNVFEHAFQVTEQPNPVLELNRLVSECIPEAIAKLEKDGRSVGGRNRARIMSNLCFKHGSSPEFFKILCQHILSLLNDRENLEKELDFWIVEVACSAQGLQEGGSFKHAVWLYLRKLTAIAISKVVSVIDACNNLDLMNIHDNIDLWLQMFESERLLNIHWPVSRLATTFAVNTTFSCHFPFFRTVFERMHKQWKIIEESKIVDNKRECFIKAIRENLDGVMFSLLELACEGRHAVTSTKSFIHDLVFQLYKRRSKDDVASFELQTVQCCVYSLFEARRKEGTKCNALVESFLLFMEIQSNLRTIAAIIAVNGDILKESATWIQEQLQHSEFTAHKLALASLIKKLHADAPKDIDGVDSCEKWRRLVSEAKPVAFHLVLESSKEIEKMWTNVVFVEIFLDQLVPTSALPDKIKKYLSALAPHARRLSIGASKCKNLSDSTFLNILTKTLESCIKEIETRLLCSWEDISCKSCKATRMNEPVLLPCRPNPHYACYKCVLGEHDSERSCPRCRTKIPADVALEPVRLSAEQSKEMKRFKSACTSFFLEYLSTFCFPTPLNDQEQQPLPTQTELLKLVFQKLVICEPTSKKVLGLFNNFGLDLVARSYILQLLMGCNPNLVKQLLNEYLKNEANDLETKTDLIEIYLRCARNVLHSNVGDSDDVNGENADISTEVESALDLLRECEYADVEDFQQIEHLGFCVSMQYIVQIAVSSVNILHEGNSRSLREEQLMTQLVANACRVFGRESFKEMQLAMVKEICRQRGMDAFDVLLKSNMFKPLVPLDLVPNRDETQKNYYLESDMLVLCGNSYINVKASLLRNITDQESYPKVFQDIVHEIQQSGDSIFQILLALSVWTGKGDIAKAQRTNAFKYMTGHLHTHLAGKSYQQLFNDVAESKLDRFKHKGLSDVRQNQLTELIVLIGVSVMWHGEGLLADLAGLITDPEQYAKAFLPTMPLAGYFAVKGLIAEEISIYDTRPKAFLCPNGHLYFIGDCTRPNQSGICPDCRQPIGGQSYDKLHAGNRAGEITEESQAGYKLKPASLRPPTTPERKLSKLSVCAIRFCLHAAMLLGSRHGKAIEQMVGERNPAAFLFNQLVKDVNELSQYLGRSVDDTIVIMHEIVNRMRTLKVPATRQSCNFQTMAAREKWEEEFQRHYLTLVFRDVDAVITKSRAVLVSAGKLADKPLERLVYEIGLNDNIPEGMLEWDCPYLWKSKIHIDMKHLNQKLEAVDAAAGGEGSVLKTILNTDNLHLIQHLDSLLDLQASFIAKYSQKIDMVDADEISLKEYLEDDDYNDEKVDLYIRIWNQVRHFLLKCDNYKSLFGYFNEDMSLNSPISMCIPSKRGRGRCAYVLVEYLIDKQNSILQMCKEHIMPRPRFTVVDASKCTQRDIININKKKDLMPIILANHRNELVNESTGPRHKITYNFGLLEKKIVEKFISRKAEIKFESVPLMLYPQDVGLTKDCNEVLKNPNIKQVPLPVRMCHDVDASVEISRTANICEAVRTLTVVIQFLAKLGADAGQTICDYSEKELLLPSEETEMIPRSAQICHCLALYERLSWHRSKRLIENGQNPFENVLECAEDIEDEDLVNKLKDELKGMSIERLQLELNALMMIGPEMRPDWSLGEEVLLNYLDSKNDADNSWCERIPKEILFKHSAHVFRLSMQAVDNKQSN